MSYTISEVRKINKINKQRVERFNELMGFNSIFYSYNNKVMNISLYVRQDDYLFSYEHKYMRSQLDFIDCFDLFNLFLESTNTRQQCLDATLVYYENKNRRDMNDMLEKDIVQTKKKVFKI